MASSQTDVCFLELWILKAKICFIIYFISICMSNTNFQENSTFSVYGFCHLLLRVTEILLLRSVRSIVLVYVKSFKGKTNHICTQNKYLQNQLLTSKYSYQFYYNLYYSLICLFLIHAFRNHLIKSQTSKLEKCDGLNFRSYDDVSKLKTQNIRLMNFFEEL